MARFRDWIDLGKSTISSLTTNEVASLYSLEWPETKRRLLEDQRASIDDEPRRLKRAVRTASAILYGLVKRLAPHRRLLFAIAMIAFFAGIFGETQDRSVDYGALFQMSAAFVAMMFLLALELIDKLKYRDELQLARDLQATLIPKRMPHDESWEVAAFNSIANTVGGDIYDFVPLPDGRMAVLFGDASGHGMAAGLVMAVAHASFRTQLEVEASPPSIMAALNRILCRTGGSRSFFSCCYILLSPDGSFLATVAGHPPILRIGADGKITDRIGRGAYPLGIKDNLTWETVGGSLAHGERLLLHSDGLTEARDSSEREFGDAYLEVIAGWHPEASAARQVETLVGEWKVFMGGIPPEDDVSIAVLRKR